MNERNCEATATVVELTEDAAFVFHAYTETGARGQGRMPALLSAAAETLRNEGGIAYLVGTTELVNLAALSAFANAGIHKASAYWQIGLGKWAAGCFPNRRHP